MTAALTHAAMDRIQPDAFPACPDCGNLCGKLARVCYDCGAHLYDDITCDGRARRTALLSRPMAAEHHGEDTEATRERGA